MRGIIDLQRWLGKSALEKKLNEILVDIEAELNTVSRSNNGMNMHGILAHIAQKRRMSIGPEDGYHWEGLYLAIAVTMLKRMVSNLLMEDYQTVELMTAEFVVNRGGRVDSMIDDLPKVYRFASHM